MTRPIIQIVRDCSGKRHIVFCRWRRVDAWTTRHGWHLAWCLAAAAALVWAVALALR